MHKKDLLLSCVVIALLFACLPAGAQQKAAFDLTRSEYMGAQDIALAHRIVTGAQDHLIPDTLWHENKGWKKAAGFGYRMIRFWLLDAQIDYFLCLAQHEAFGHGARYREMGLEENSFHLNLFFPYGDGSGYARSGNLKPGFKITPQERITEILGGNEANQVLSNELRTQMLIDDAIHYRQADMYLISRNNLIAYIWQTRIMKNSRVATYGDIASYMFEVNSLYWRRGQTYRVFALSEQSLLTLADPMELYAAYTLLVSYGIKGKKTLDHIPMIPVGKLRYLPSLNYSLTPFGSRYHFTQDFIFAKRLLSADIHVGDSRFYTFYGIAVDGYRLLNLRAISLDAGIQFWRQPDLELNDYFIRQFGYRYGGLVKSTVHLRPLKLPRQLGVFVELGYKTRGYTFGEALGEGLLLRFGLSGKL